MGGDPWRTGSGEIKEYVKSSDIRSWIRRVENGVNKEYARKLAQRTISRLIDYSNNRISVQKKTQRKNGLSYKEKFVEIRADAQIPGETAAGHPSPGINGVVG